MLTSLYFFGKKENITWGNIVLFDIMDDPTYVVAAIEEFTNISEDDAVSSFDCFFDEENNDWDQFFNQSLHCVQYFLKDLFEIRKKEKINVPPLGVL